MTTIFLFPGQGSQTKGMGKRLFDRFPDQVAQADAVLGYSIRTLCLEDPRNELAFTQFTQPALYVVGALEYMQRMQDGERAPDFVAGHSLGEYGALFAAEAFDFVTGLKLVKKRGELMGSVHGGGMAAVVGLEAPALREVMAEAGVEGVDVANFNTPTQTVLAGPVEDLDRLQPALEARKGTRVVRLRVNTAFHSRHMRSLKEPFAAFVAGFSFRPLTIPVISNFTALPYRDDEIAHNLVQQIDHSVRWVESVQYLLQEEDAAFVEIGETGILTRMVQEIRKHPVPVNIGRRY